MSTPSKTRPRKVDGRKAAAKLRSLLHFDEKVLAECPPGTLLIGIDEVGRGSCIGPVTAAAVAYPATTLNQKSRRRLREVNDSKQLLAEQREALCAAVQDLCLWAVGEATKDEVELHNVHYASLLAAYRAYEQLCYKLSPEQRENTLVLLDGRSVIPDLRARQQKAIVKGDGKSFVIAAASVVAKHTRDRYIMHLARQYPGYGWETNMGYGTSEHRRALETLGPTEHHRSHYKAVLDSQLCLNLPEAD